MDAHPVNGGVRLSKLFSRARFFRADEIRVTACCTDYDRCQPGDLYVATVDADRDGHDYVYDAISRGATAILTERLLPVEVPQCIVPDARIAFGRLCHRLAGNPGDRLHVVGVAGKRGKHVAQLLMTHVIEQAGSRPASLGRRAYSDGARTLPPHDSPPSAARHARWLAASSANGCSHAVAELPARELARGNFAGMGLDTALLTELGPTFHRRSPSHHDRNYFRRLLGRLKRDGIVVANVDCPMVRDFVSDVDRPILTVGMEAPADITASVLERSPYEQTFLLEAGDDSAVVCTPMIGDAFVRYSMLAAAAGLSMDFDLPSVVRGLESVEEIPGLLQRVECGQNFRVFVDNCPTPSALSRALNTLRTVTEGRLICVLGEGGAASGQVRGQRGRLAERFADHIVLTSDDARNERPLDAVHDLLDGFRSPAKAHVLPNRVRAIEWALDEARAGDVVLVAGVHDQPMARPDAHLPSDVDVVKFWLLGRKDQNLDWLLAAS